MFHPLGLFKKISCPKQHECPLQNCIFDHDLPVGQNGEAGSAVYDPFSAGEVEAPAPKRRRVESPEPDLEESTETKQTQNSVTLSQRPLKALKLEHNSSRPDKELQMTSQPISQPRKQDVKTVKPSQLASVKRTVSPPLRKEQQKSCALKVEKLVPRPVPQAPALLKVRMSLIDVLYKQMSNLNSQIDKGEAKPPRLVLTDQQIISLVLDEEEAAARKLNSDIYRNAMSQRILQVKKMKLEDWMSFINDKLNPSQNAQPDATPSQASAGLSPDQEVLILRYLRTNLTGLDAHGYVTKPPTAADIQKSKDSLRTAGGYEVCDRCGTRFQVFPGRDEQGRLTTKGECYYHWAKLNRAQWQKTDHITGQAQSSYSCCNKPLGSEGCTQGASHVFKVTDSKRMAMLWQFEPTPSKNDGKKRGPVAFDCEMAYTTYGMELIRVTAVSWPQNKELLDVLVRPFGEILDLNTRFSGVSHEQYATALPYGTIEEHHDDTSEEGEVEPEPLRKVGSPSAARQLMFDLLTPETPLIGHAIDNDLNACRMIHPFVIDTVLLYPHPRGLPIRFGLRVLASKHLQRSIQTGGEAGHDSKEDSIATGDLVRVKVAEKWQMMRLQGWKFDDNSLVPPGR